MRDRPIRLRRVAVPAAAACLGVYLLIGCIPLPSDYRRTHGGERPEKQIGASGDAGRPLRLGRSTRDDVIRVLRTPSFTTRDGRAFAYMYMIRTGVLLWPLCFRAEDLTSARYLVLQFDDAGVLSSFKVAKRIDDGAQQFVPGPDGGTLR